MPHGMITAEQRLLILGLAEELDLTDDQLLGIVFERTGRSSLDRLRYTDAARVRAELVRIRTARGVAAERARAADTAAG